MVEDYKRFEELRKNGMNKVRDYRQQTRGSEKQIKDRQKLYDLFSSRPMPDDQLLINLGLYMRSSAVAKILYLDELYRKVLKLPGVIMEFGIWWGQNIVLFESLRAVHEPYNHSRRVIGFDTFKGYPKISDKDILSETIKVGGYTVNENYEEYLEKLIEYHEQENVMAHIKKHKLIKGDVTQTIDKFLKENPETIIALVYLDLALYEPTKKCLEAIRPHLIKGSVIAFDELNCPDYPGETVALKETWGLDKYSIYRSEYIPDRSYIVID